jgi:hypothetical protein
MPTTKIPPRENRLMIDEKIWDELKTENERLSNTNEKLVTELTMCQAELVKAEEERRQSQVKEDKFLDIIKTMVMDKAKLTDIIKEYVENNVKDNGGTSQ